MSKLFEFPLGNHLHKYPIGRIALNSFKIPHEACFPISIRTAFTRRKWLPVLFPSPVSSRLVYRAEPSLQTKNTARDGEKTIEFPHVQTLRNFPKEEILGKVFLVRFDSTILLHGKKEEQSPSTTAFCSIKYLYELGAKVILVGSWSENTNRRLASGAYPSTESVADFLSSVLEIKVAPIQFSSGCKHADVEDSQNSDIFLLENLCHFKGELANCSKFSKELATGVDVVVNDDFSQSHKILASTVGVASLCHAYIAGFYFEEGLSELKKIIRTSERPYMAIIGGGNFADKAAALQILASICDGLVFVGNMGFQIMHAIGISVPLEFVELGALKEAINIVESAKLRNIPLVIPKDIWCIKNHDPQQLELFSVNSMPTGWHPVDIGPSSLQEMVYLLSNCKKILWIGPLKFRSSTQDRGGAFKLVEALNRLHQNCSNITFVGKLQLEELLRKSKSFSKDNFVKNAAIVWEVLKGRKLPGLVALDRAYPFHVEWNAVYGDPEKPLLVRCWKWHFFATNATNSFRSIVSSYPGELVLASIQCPNPDFNKPEYRWRMIQRSLIEAIADILIFGGKVFVQSDVEAVSLRLKKEFMKYSKGKLVVVNYNEEDTTDAGQWLKENPFGVPSDWEQHVLDRGDPMYRLLLSKVG